MKIGIDANEANVPYLAGIGQYALEMLRAIYSLRKENGCLHAFEIYLKDKPSDELPEEKSWWRYKVFGTGGYWVEKDLMIRLWREKILKKQPDVFWSLTHYAPIPVAVPLVLSIMDLAYLKFPSYFRKNDLLKLVWWTKYSVKNSTKIITISHFTQSEIMKNYHMEKRKIAVAYPGFDEKRFYPKRKEERKSIHTVKEKYGISDDYLLFLGTSQPRKNLTRLVKAFSQISNRITCQLVISGMVNEGRGGWMNREISDLMDNKSIKNNIKVTGYLSEKEKEFILAGCRALVLPSLYEGFGLPAVEAMATGIPVILSKNSSLEEIGGQVAIYIDNPYNIEDITQSIMKTINLSADQLKERVIKGLNRVKKFSYQKSALTALKTLEEASGTATGY